MSSKRQELGVVASYADLLAILRSRVGALDMNYSILDVVTGFTSTYSTKLLAEGSGKFFSDKSFDAFLEALGVELIAVENVKKTERTKDFLAKRLLKRTGTAYVLSGGKHEPVKLTIPRRIFRAKGRAGGKQRAINLGPRKRKHIAKAAATKRWERTTQKERAAIGALLRAAREKRRLEKLCQSPDDALTRTAPSPQQASKSGHISLANLKSAKSTDIAAEKSC